MTPDDDKVVGIGKAPFRLTTEMQIRWLMSNMDKVRSLVLVVDIEGQNPMVSISSHTSAYFLALASSILDHEALARMPIKEKGPHKGEPKDLA